jgi:hypothetical protein
MHLDAEALSRALSRLERGPWAPRIARSFPFVDAVRLRDYFAGPRKELGRPMCRIPWTRATILPNGDCVIHNRCVEFRTGNILERRFEEIWRGDAYTGFRGALRRARRLPACARCCGTIARG